MSHLSAEDRQAAGYWKVYIQIQGLLAPGAQADDGKEEREAPLVKYPSDDALLV
jgi:hypothetical protein